jgi:hypothetical protein
MDYRMNYGPSNSPAWIAQWLSIGAAAFAIAAVALAMVYLAGGKGRWNAFLICTCLCLGCGVFAVVCAYREPLHFTKRQALSDALNEQAKIGDESVAEAMIKRDLEIIAYTGMPKAEAHTAAHNNQYQAFSLDAGSPALRYSVNAYTAQDGTPQLQAWTDVSPSSMSVDAAAAQINDSLIRALRDYDNLDHNERQAVANAASWGEDR